ncbi:unnamed protein product [Aspergillus oryzae RIB40]|uniref:DNA, SC023 n=1 Tax=Aspergillus oryzae (strain ATCC 42149 / RIB 40) TaxID=510516 RepID=Q2UHF9_ASPOR|nr:unnamed protein product [Aspergillus oryzae RIB40]BAE59006.1 unnamed protein product [Aspergillus oryzae RIB40]
MDIAGLDTAFQCVTDVLGTDLIVPDLLSSESYKICIALPKRSSFADEKPAGRLDGLWIRPSRKRNQNSPHATTQPEPNVETLVQYDLCHAPDEIDPKEGEDETWLKFSFYLPIPSNIPPTTETVLGSVSYAITATVAPSTISSTRILKDTQQIKMSRRVVSEPIRHIRQYPGERVLTELSMVPSQLYTDTPEEMKVAYSLEWVAHSTIAKGARDMEVKYVVGKELKWRVEETVKYLSISRGGNPQREAVTTTCKEQRIADPG